MGDRSKIEWTDATWSPIRGCSRVSRGCEHCYAERIAWRLQQAGYAGLTRMTEHGPVWTGEVRLVPELLDQPLRWQRSRKIFPCSMSDLFHPLVPDTYIAAVFGIMAWAQWHTFQVTTKRIEEARRWFEWIGTMENPARTCFQYADSEVQVHSRSDFRIRSGIPFSWPLPNVWLGVSVEDQKTADERIPLLLQTPAAIRWVSAEPLLGPIDFTKIPAPNQCTQNALDGRNNWNGRLMPRIHWVVVGGESGPGARPIHPDWVRSIRDQCQAAGVPFFMKQWGEWGLDRPRDYCRLSKKRYSHESITFRADGREYQPDKPDQFLEKDMVTMYRIGKKAAGHLLDGREWREYPG